MIENTTKLTAEQQAQIRHWAYPVGCELVACDSRNKKYDKEYWKSNPDNNPDYNALLREGWYDEGVAIICGQLRHGDFKDKHLAVFDFDDKETFDKFLDLLSTNLEQLAKWTRVEWHKNDSKFHVFFITNEPFENLVTITF